LLGVAGFRGALIPVYDLRALLGCSITGAPRWLALARGVPIAVAFDGMDGHLPVEPGTVASSEGGGPLGRYVREVVRASNGIRPIVHIAAVLDAITERAAHGISQKES
jgi:purine-binding chemotaxis protein CheW